MSVFSISRRNKFLLHSVLRHDVKASVTVFFVALPLCMGVALASGTPVYAGIAAGIIGGIVVSLFSKSELSVSGPAAGLTAICASAITDLGAPEIFFLSVAVAGVLQFLLGVLKLGGFTHFIPSAVIKGMLSAIGVLLIAKQVPLLIGYDKPDFWTNELFNLLTFTHGFSQVKCFYEALTPGAMVIAAGSFVMMWAWQKWAAKKVSFLPSSFVLVVLGSLLALLLNNSIPYLKLQPAQYVQLPASITDEIRFPNFSALLSDAKIWRYAVVICFVASLETLLSIEAIDKLDPYNRLTPQNRELMAQGAGNMLSGLVGGLPITAVIVRSSANAEAGARSRMSAILHGVWLLLAVLLLVPLINNIPYTVLAVILIRTGYNLAKPSMIKAVYKQGREQFLPFIFTIVAILFTDLLTGVLIGMVYAVYFIIKHTYRAGFTMQHLHHNGLHEIHIELASNVSFLNKKKLLETLDGIPEYAELTINGCSSVYIDQDVLEIIQSFKPKAHKKHIALHLINIPEVATIELH
ncbi:MAG: SulP family inorganic anion transporter [Chitinophagaceae bacterium]|nr:SulP family inorganic anion transporter [Chitinophagaceae bacterium]